MICGVANTICRNRKLIAFEKNSSGSVRQVLLVFCLGPKAMPELSELSALQQKGMIQQGHATMETLY
jgi:hypothetical protein